MSLHPSVEFRALRTKLTLKSTVSRLWSYRSTRTTSLNRGRSCLVHAPTTVQTTTRSLERFRPPTFDQVEVHKKHQQHGQGKTQHCTHNRKKSAKLGRVVVDTQHSFVLNYTGTVESSFVCFVPHAARMRIRRVSVSFGMTALPRPTFKSAASLQLETQVHLTWPNESGLELRCCHCHARWLQQDFASFVYLACLDRASALMRPWWCDPSLA